MIKVTILTETRHRSNHWQPGDQPTLTRALALELIQAGQAKPADGEPDNLRGITNEELEEIREAEIQEEQETKSLKTLAKGIAKELRKQKK